jgi:hypothetical protein
VSSTLRTTYGGAADGSRIPPDQLNKPKLVRGKRQRYTKKSRASTKLATSMFPAKQPKISKKWSPDPPKSSLGASKIEPGAIQDAIFNRHFICEGSKGQVQKFSEAKIANMAPTWRPKTFQNRGRNLEKLMLKNKLFLASIFQRFGPRFGMVFGSFFGQQNRDKF